MESDCNKTYLVVSFPETNKKKSKKRVRVILVGLLRFWILHLKPDYTALVNYRITSLRTQREGHCT